jgi:hypothetical protein
MEGALAMGQLSTLSMMKKTVPITRFNKGETKNMNP